MTMEVYPVIPVPSWSYPFDEAFATMISDYEGEGKQGQILQRFPKRGFSLGYKTIDIVNEWPLIHNFFRKRRGSGDVFWYFDFFKRAFVDEYIGRGGPFQIDGAVADDGGVQTDETDAGQNATVNDMILLPAVPAVNDAYYFGSKIMFDKLTVTIGIAGAGTWTIVWEYWNGTTWGQPSGISDGTTGFKAAAGDHDVTFTMPSNWVDCIVKARNLYWIRARVSAYTSVTTQPKGTKATVNTKTYDLPSKTTDNDSSLIIYVNDVVTSKTFLSAGGGGGADRITLSGYQTTGALITADLKGYLRLKAIMQDKFSDEIFSPTYGQIATVKIAEW
jgi:hypothetical protein